MDDLKPTNEPIQPEPIPQPTEPAAPPTDQPTVPPEPLSPQPSQTSPIQTTTITTGEPPPPALTTEKPPGKKIPSSIKIGGALVILLMAATLPATIILVQNKTTIAPKAQEEASEPKHPTPEKLYSQLTAEQQQEEWVKEIKPQNLKIEAVSSDTVKISFNTQGAFLSSILYSPDENWNYLTMIQEGDWTDEWRQRYHPENQKYVEPVGGKEIKTEHEFILENLVPGQKYYFAIRVENPEAKIVYEFGLEQPENHYIFVAE